MALRIKYILLVLLCCLASEALTAQSPQKIYPYSREQRPAAWYKEQVAAWRNVIDKNPKNATAWYNYYYANRLLLRFNPEEKKSEEEKSAVFNEIARQMEQNVPDSYEYNMVKWLIGGSDQRYLPYLEKAAELAAPDRTEHLDGMINTGEIQRNIIMRDRYSKQKFDAGEVSPGMLYYNYNTLIGLEPDAILITAGDNDTYPAFVLQSLGIRKDVHVVNAALIQIDEYRDKLFKELGLDPWEKLWGNTHSAEEAALQRFRKKILAYMATNKKGCPLYVALTAAYLIQMSDPQIEANMFVTGLAIKYNKAPFDNIRVLKENFERLYALDYLDKSFFPDFAAPLVKVINTNYVVPMLNLYDYYKTSGDEFHGMWIAGKLREIVRDTPLEEEVKKHLASK